MALKEPISDGEWEECLKDHVFSLGENPPEFDHLILWNGCCHICDEDSNVWSLMHIYGFIGMVGYDRWKELVREEKVKFASKYDKIHTSIRLWVKRYLMRYNPPKWFETEEE